MGRLLAFLILGFSPFLVHASDNSCLDQIRKSLVQNPSKLPEEMGKILNFYVGPNPSPVRSEEKFYRYFNEESKTTSIGYEYESPVSDSRTVEVAYDISPVNAWGRESIFEVEQSVVLKDRSGAKFFEDEVTLGFNQNCQAQKVRHKTNSYLYQSDGLMLTARDAESGLGPKVYRFKIDSKGVEQLKVIGALNRLHGILKLVGKTIEYPEVEEGELSSKHVMVVQRLTTERFNILSQKLEVMDGLEYVSGPVKAVTYFSQDEMYVFTLTEFGGTKIFTETVRKQQWFDLVLDRDLFKTAKIQGFQGKDFSDSILRFEIKGERAKAPLLHNESKYFRDVQRIEEAQSERWSIVVSSYMPNIPAAVSWEAPHSVDDKKYLAFSKYIQAEPVSILVEAIRPKLRGLDRLAATQVILETVTRVLTYDASAVGKNLVQIRSVDEVLREKKGVCQHYAALFVSIARSLGIPSRIVTGYLIDKDEAVGHAWVEVKLNEMDWWPLEPQIISKSLPHRGYIPMAELSVYESPIGSSSDESLTLYGEIAKIKTSWENVTITKLP